jgi:hypothetical protein
MWSVPRSYLEDKWRDPVKLPVQSQSVKRRLGGWCEMVASLGVVSCQLSSAREAVKIESELVKLRIPIVRSICQGTADEKTAGW